jgi:hypothetical protein
VTSGEIKELANLWIQAKGRYSPAFDRLYDLCNEGPENAWLMIQEIASKEISNEIMAVLAAGPVEDLLVRHGQGFIDRIEEKARNDSKFNLMLGGVWQNAMAPEVWERVKSVHKQIW